jgi:hypothetical protein
MKYFIFYLFFLSTYAKQSGKIESQASRCNNNTKCIECNQKNCFHYQDNICKQIGTNKVGIITYHIFFGLLGVSAFILGNTFWGSLQIGFTVSPLLWGFCFACPRSEDQNKRIFHTLSGFSFIMSFSMYITYLCFLVDDQIRDKHDCPLV